MASSFHNIWTIRDLPHVPASNELQPCEQDLAYSKFFTCPAFKISHISKYTIYDSEENFAEVHIPAPDNMYQIFWEIF